MAIKGSIKLMATPNFSALFPDITLNQLDALTKLYGINKTQVMIRSISDQYRKEFPMNIELNYQPRIQHKSYTIEIATGIGGYYARTSVKIDEDTTELVEIGPNETERGALQAMYRTIQDTLFAHGLAAEPAPYFPN